MTRYDTVMVMSYKDEEMAGTESTAREHGKWFVHGINETADLIGTFEDEEKAIEKGKETAQPEEDGTTEYIKKNMESEIEERITFDQTTIEPEEDNQ